MLECIKDAKYGLRGNECLVGELCSNCDGSINRKMKERLLKDADVCGQYSALNFCGYVWFQDGMWNCWVWCHKVPQELVSARSIKAIMATVSDKYGYE